MAGKLVSEVMTKGLKNITKDASLSDAKQLMDEKSIHHLLIVEKEELVGIISDRDVKKFMSPFVGSARETEQDKATLGIKVEKVMAKNLVTVKPEDTLKTCVQKMLEKSINAVPVVDAATKRPVGMITTRNLLQLLMQILD